MRHLTRWLPLLILLPLWGAGFALHWSAERAIVSGLREKLMVTLAAHAHDVRSALRAQERYVQVLTNHAADALANGVIPTLDVTDLSSHLPETVSCAIFDRKGRVIAHSGAPESLLADMGRGLPEYPVIRITNPATDASGQASYTLFLPLITPGGAPVIHQTDAWVGSLGCHLREILSESLAITREALGLSGEAYLVSAQARRMLTASRFVPKAIGRLPVETEGVRQALTVGRGLAVYPDYRGIPVWGAFLYLPEYDWVLLVEIDETEAVMPLMRFRSALLVTLGLLSITAWFVGWRYERRLSDAMGRLHEAKVKADEAEGYLRVLFESVLSGIVEGDERGVITAANPAAHALFGWPPGELIGQNVTVLMGPADADPYRAGMARYLATGRSTLIGRVFEVTGVRKDGARIPCEVALAEHRGVDGSRRFVGVLRDMSAQKREEAQATRLNGLAMLRYLLEGLTHAVKNPLFILQGRIDLLGHKLERPDYEVFRGDVARALDAVKRLGKVFDHFTAVVAAAPARRPCSVEAAWDAMLPLVAEDLDRHRIALRATVAPGLPPVMADPHELHQIFLEPLRNAIEAMAGRGQGTLTVRMARVPAAETRGGGDTGIAASAAEGGWIEVRIQDDGPGIAPEHRDRLFDPFFTTKPEGGAAGLGLWTVRNIVMALHGTVTYETAVGGGTTIIVRLPTAQEPAE